MADLLPIEISTTDGRRLAEHWAALEAPPYPEFHPEGLQQSYEDLKTRLVLPVFAVFSLWLPGVRRYIIPRTGSLEKVNTLNLLEAFLPWTSIRNAFSRREDRRDEGAPWVILAIGMSLVAFVIAISAHFDRRATIAALLFVAAGVSLLLLAFLLADRFWKGGPGIPGDLHLEARFEGILPSHIREKAKHLRALFEEIYIVSDQRERWKSKFLPAPVPPLADPLLVGQKTLQDGTTHFYLLDSFDLTPVEQYLADEFSTRPGTVMSRERVKPAV